MLISKKMIVVAYKVKGITMIVKNELKRARLFASHNGKSERPFIFG